MYLAVPQLFALLVNYGMDNTLGSVDAVAELYNAN